MGEVLVLDLRHVLDEILGKIVQDDAVKPCVSQRLVDVDVFLEEAKEVGDDLGVICLFQLFAVLLLELLLGNHEIADEDIFLAAEMTVIGDSADTGLFRDVSDGNLVVVHGLHEFQEGVGDGFFDQFSFHMESPRNKVDNIVTFCYIKRKRRIKGDDISSLFFNLRFLLEGCSSSTLTEFLS